MNSDQGSEDDSNLSAFQSQTSLGSSLQSSFDSEASQRSEDYEEGNDVPVDAEFKKRFDQVKAEYIQVRNKSTIIQRKLFDQFNDIGYEDTSSSPVGDFPHRYQDALDQLEVKKSELQEMRERYDLELRELQERCAQAEQAKLAKEDAFKRLREEKAQESVMQRTNKPVKMQDINTKESQLDTKEIELENCRIDFIRAKSKHKETQDLLDQQDQLSEGLHLIDFEQLKIENQTLNEKKAEKSQDLVKISVKIGTNAHTLTHVKEKLAFVRRQKAALQVRQDEVDREYVAARASLASSRIHRDKVRDENSALKKSSGLIGMTDLLYDFEKRANELELMQDRVTELKTRYNDLLVLQHELEAKIAQRQPLDPALLRHQ